MRRSIVTWGLRLLGLVLLVLAGQRIIHLVGGWLDMALMPHTEDFLHQSIVLGTGLYVGLMAIPFVPGAEIGLTLLTVLGGAIAPLIYLATATSLSISYLVGRLQPPDLLHRGLTRLGLARAAALVEKAGRMGYEELQDSLIQSNTPKALRALLRYRYVALAIAINTPGNVVLGGGGGLALVAGLSRLFAPLPFLLTVLVAVLPVPALFYFGQL